MIIMKKALIYGVLSSLFFAFTFIFNRSMHLSGGYWMWGACLRYLFLLLLLIAAFSYPLGNRKMMQHCPVFLNTVQRVFGMTLSSMPFWLITAAAAFLRSGLPSRGQLLQSFAVALFSGVIATILFFHATDLVKENPRQLAVIEATQCGEVIFTLIGGILVLGDRIPEPMGFSGLLLIIGGMILNSFL